ncbi:MAG: LVIVD repeat-containing protein, partial [Actinomycetota bacterium]
MKGLAAGFVMVALVALGAPASAQEEHSDNVSLLASVELGGATDVEFTKDGYAVLTVNGSGEFAGLWVIDVRNPAKPKTLGHLPCFGSGYDVGLWRNVAVMSSDSASQNSSTEGGCNVKGTDGQEGIRLVDISDRNHPREIKFVETQCGSHTNVVVPRGSKAYVYVQSYPASTSGACPSAHGIISVVDITNPAKAKVVSTPSVAPAVGCHDGAIAGKLAYMACLTEGQVWDISDPTKPEIVTHIRDVPDAIWHSSDTSNDGKTAIFGFESFQGGPLSCNEITQAPFGALWFYDVSDPASPEQLGSFVPPRTIGGTCTAHNFAVIPGIERDALVTAWYSAGF